MKHESILEGVAIEPWRQHLLDAAAYMEEHGHCKDGTYGKFSTGIGPVCLLGAIFAIKGTAEGRAESALYDYFIVRHETSVVGWNDRPETTKDMAVAALIGAALQ